MLHLARILVQVTIYLFVKTSIIYEVDGLFDHPDVWDLSVRISVCDQGLPKQGKTS